MQWWHDSAWMWIVMLAFWGCVALGLVIAADRTDGAPIA